MSKEEVRHIARDYKIFGRVSPNQKQAIIEALKVANCTINDIDAVVCIDTNSKYIIKRVIGLPMCDEYDLIIGMDIITQGDLSITNYDGHTAYGITQAIAYYDDYISVSAEAGEETE